MNKLKPMRMAGYGAVAGAGLGAAKARPGERLQGAMGGAAKGALVGGAAGWGAQKARRGVAGMMGKAAMVPIPIPKQPKPPEIQQSFRGRPPKPHVTQTPSPIIASTAQMTQPIQTKVAARKKPKKNSAGRHILGGAAAGALVGGSSGELAGAVMQRRAKKALRDAKDARFKAWSNSLGHSSGPALPSSFDRSIGSALKNKHQAALQVEQAAVGAVSKAKHFAKHFPSRKLIFPGAYLGVMGGSILWRARRKKKTDKRSRKTKKAGVEGYSRSVGDRGYA